MADILWLDQVEAQQLPLVGGKVAALSRFATDYLVPPGFCIPTTLLDKCQEDKGGAVDQGKNRISKELDQKVRSAYRQLAACCGGVMPHVAVRSSAIDEDGKESSFAGQYESYLNIVGADQVIEAVQQCWSSAHTDRVMVYRQEKGSVVQKISVAVLVQQLVMADVSLVAFSANPLTGSRDEVLINASWGLGESIVGGTVTPDTYQVNRGHLDIISQEISTKSRMTIASSNGTKETAVPRFLQNQSSLNEQQIQAVAQLAIELEVRMNTPVDIECAYHAENLYLLQCRPITTLYSQTGHSTTLVQ